MSVSPDTSPAARAARWFARMRGEAVDARADSEFSQWLKDAPQNEGHYERCELTWELAAELRGRPAIEAMLAAADEAAAHSDGGRAASSKILGKTGRWLAAACVVLAAAAVLYVLAPFGVLHYRTGVGQQRTVRLEDGSILTLNTSTQIRVAFERRARTVFLDEGEALFSVHEDPNRPFEVHALGGIARAIGTQFAVDRAGAAATVSVLQGSVAVFPAGGRAPLQGAARLSPGQAATYVQGGAAPDVHPANLRRIGAWRTHRVEFNDETLGSAIADYNRYIERPIVLASPELAEHRIYGAFDIGDTKSLLFALQEALPVRVVEQPDAIVLLKKSR